MDLLRQLQPGQVYANSSCMWLLESTIYSVYKSSVWFAAMLPWQELWMLMGWFFKLVSFRLGTQSGEGNGGLILSNLGVYIIIDTYGLADQHSSQADQ